MSGSYQPTNGSLFSPLWKTVFLSQRDLSGQVPINFVLKSGISITAACFGDGQYKDDEAAQCFSNLIALGYRRFVLDLYWQSNLQQWSFCPIAVPKGGASTSSSVTSTNAMSSFSSSSVSSLNATSALNSNTTTSAGTKSRRQELASSSISALTTPSRSVSTTPPSAAPTTVEGQSMDLGPVSCTSTVNLDILVNVLHDYIHSTEDTLKATLVYLVINIHAAGRSNATGILPAAAPSKSNLPSESELVGSIFAEGVGSYIYTPTELRTERSNLNASWFSAPQQRQPIVDYFNMDESTSGVWSTADGWPCENYIEVSRGKRLLLNWGTIDPQLQDYNFTSDDNTIFPRFALDSPVNISVNAHGDIVSGCLFDPNSTSISAVNSSWAQASQGRSNLPIPDKPGDSLAPLATLALNLTNCGISPIINITLLNTTASSNPEPYQNISYSAVWSWTRGEPRNSTQDTNDDAYDDNSSHFRCALFDPRLQGRWRVEDCGARYFGACRVANMPYNWALTSSPVPYSSVDDACPNNSTFSVPRTGLENSYLYSHLVNEQAVISQDVYQDYPGVWIDFNSLDVRACWTSGGANATCPYAVDSAEVQRRTILVPTIAAIIIAITTALTLFVKCNANRRSSRGAGRRRKRGDGGWDYEGVPS